MNCIWVEKLSSLIDGELPADEARAMERHLVGCLECQQARADFLNFRSQITTFSPTLDKPATQEALARILARPEIKPIVNQPRARSLGWFEALRFRPAYAALAVLILAGTVGLILYKNVARQAPSAQPPVGESLADNKRAPRGTSPKPASSPESSSNGPESASGPATKPSNGKGAKPKARPVFVPKLPTVPDDRISPTANQAIAENWLEGDASNLTGMSSVESQTLTARHLEQSEFLLRAFRNVRTDEADTGAEVSYEKQRAQRLVYQNIMLRREADSNGDVQVSTLLESLEPILIDIANLPDKPQQEDVKAIKERLQRKKLVALLQVNSTALARAND